MELYSNLKPFMFPEKIDSWKQGKLASPVHLRIKPLNACNHSCWFCAYRADSLELGQDMSLRDRIPHEKMNEIAEDIIEMRVRAVTFSGGGEPLLYKPLPSVVRTLGKAGVKVASLTNGTYLHGDIADAFAEHGTWVRISMDYWDEKSCSESRKTKAGEFSRIIENIRDFSKRGSRCVLGVSLIVTEDNAPHIFSVCALLKDAGVNHIKLSPCIVSNCGSENNRYHERFKATVLEQIERAKTLRTSVFSIVDHYHQISETFDKPYTRCPLMQFLAVIGADCNVYTCQDKAYTQSGMLGSVKDRRFKEFWFSKENEEKIFSFNPQIECQHHCVGNSKNIALNNFINLNTEHSAFV